jgi:hypothetical protein
MAKIGTQARAVMAALDAGRPMRRMGDAWRAGALVATAAVVGELVRHDLVRMEGDLLVATAAGRGFTTRTETPEAANRLIGERALSPADEGAPTTATRRAGRRVTVNLGESPLGWLKARGLVSERQFAAGERLRGDWTAAQLAPRVTMRWDAGPSSHSARGPSGAIDPTLAQIAAKQRFEAATAATGAGLGDIAWRVICAGEGLEAAERGLGWPKRAGKLVLLMALDRLADHYGLAD